MRYLFADCELDSQRLTLRRAGHLRHLRPKAFAVLLYLVLHRDRVVGKQELCEQVWPEQFISDATVESTLRAVRQTVGDSGKAQRLIQTLHRHGYRFVADVSEHGEERPAAGLQTVEGRPVAEVGQREPATAATVLPPVPDRAVLLQEEQAQRTPVDSSDGESRALPALGHADAEHRHLTVLCCDVVDASVPETSCDLDTLHDVIRAAHATCAAVVAHFEGYVAQYRGDGLVAYFGFPQAHEDDAQRAVRAGLAIVEAMQHGTNQAAPFQGRVGIHTGPVVIGVLEAGTMQGPLVLGGVPQGASQLLVRAAPQTVVISAAVWHLVAGWFVGERLASQALSDISQLEPRYRVLRASGAQGRLDVVSPERLTPLVGRTSELAVLQERWAQARDGLGQAVLLIGEAGIGKSRLAETLRPQVTAAGYPQIILHCSPYHTHSALFPVCEHLRQVARIHPEDAPATKLDKLEQMLRGYRLAPEEVVPLFAALLAVPLGQRYPPVVLTPERHKQRTYAALTAWLHAEAERQPLFILYEDLHWADPSTLELLGLWMEQIPTLRVLMLLLCRPEFHPPWGLMAPITQLTLSRFTRSQVEQMLDALVGTTPLPTEIREQVIAHADGVPLFLEELVKMLLESELMQVHQGSHGRSASPLPLAVPVTLADALMARLDRLGSARDLAQLGATWGREFTYAQMQSLVLLEEDVLQQRLTQLVEAAILYQRGLPPHTSYRFKHALIQETAYRSLVRSTRQSYHRRIAQVLAARFPETAETQSELLAHHYTEAGLSAEAIPYWQRAGQYAQQRSANLEAIQHLTQGLRLLTTLPETPVRIRQELALQIALGPVWMALKGFAAPEVEQAYTRAHILCEQLKDSPQRFPVLWGLWWFYTVRAAFQRARELAHQLLELAHSIHDAALVLIAHRSLAITSLWCGEWHVARTHAAEGIALYQTGQHRSLAFLYAEDPGVGCLAFAAYALMWLGYPDQARERCRQALTLARDLAHPPSLARALFFAALIYQACGEMQATEELVEAAITLNTAQGLSYWLTGVMMVQGWMRAHQGQAEKGFKQIQQGLAAHQATGAQQGRPYFVALLAEAYRQMGQVDAGLEVLDAVLRDAEKTGEHFNDAELYRMKGELLWSQAAASGGMDSRPPERSTRLAADAIEAETCFRQALNVAQSQQAKYAELRAALSLSRLWQNQGKRAEARLLLAPIHGWFTEGLDTADLQGARTLLEALR